MAINTFRINNSKRMNNVTFFAVKTRYNLQQVKLVCAYLQNIRRGLPRLGSPENTLPEKMCLLLLSQLYGMTTILTPTPYSSEINLDLNSTEIDLDLSDIREEINKYAVCDASLSLLRALLADKKEQAEQQKIVNGGASYELIRDIEQLTRVIKGGKVEAEWGWLSLTGESLTDRYYTHSARPELIAIDASAVAQTMAEDWHRADIIAAVKKSGCSLAALSRQSGLSSPTLANALYRKWPKGERIIASHLQLHPAEIWPSRY